VFLADFDEFQDLAAPLRDMAGAAAGAASTFDSQTQEFLATWRRSACGAWRKTRGGGMPRPMHWPRI